MTPLFSTFPTTFNLHSYAHSVGHLRERIVATHPYFCTLYGGQLHALPAVSGMQPRLRSSPGMTGAGRRIGRPEGRI